MQDAVGPLRGSPANKQGTAGVSGEWKRGGWGGGRGRGGGGEGGGGGGGQGKRHCSTHLIAEARQKQAFCEQRRGLFRFFHVDAPLPGTPHRQLRLATVLLCCGQWEMLGGVSSVSLPAGAGAAGCLLFVVGPHRDKQRFSTGTSFTAHSLTKPLPVAVGADPRTLSKVESPNDLPKMDDEGGSDTLTSREYAGAELLDADQGLESTDLDNGNDVGEQREQEQAREEGTDEREAEEDFALEDEAQEGLEDKEEDSLNVHTRVDLIALQLEQRKQEAWLSNLDDEFTHIRRTFASAGSRVSPSNQLSTYSLGHELTPSYHSSSAFNRGSSSCTRLRVVLFSSPASLRFLTEPPNSVSEAAETVNARCANFTHPSLVTCSRPTLERGADFSGYGGQAARCGREGAKYSRELRRWRLRQSLLRRSGRGSG